jgi:peptidoglycan/LPS O-acetylase OafA/YrhL/predicted transport protein
MTTNAPHSSLHPAYRSDIDGLRAVAILSVLIFHAFPKWLPGGFIGVDIFFVISGFLISSIIFKGVMKNKFSFIDFYARRIKRIYPALLVMLAACLGFGWLVMLNAEYQQLGKHVLGGVGFVQNIVLKNEAGYFDVSAEFKPLLHLWSLGIEEQFYFVWPFLIYAGYRFRSNLLFFTIVVCAVSFAINIARLNTSLVSVFYHPVTRFWELFIGAILAYISLHPEEYAHKFSYISLKNTGLSEKILNQAKATLGLILILLALFLLDPSKKFPGFWALLPTIGAALLIAAGNQAWVNRVILSNKFMVWVGLISFPLYLWHWPLLAFGRIVESDGFNDTSRLICLALSFLLAWLTYEIIEKRVRKAAHFPITFYLMGVSVLLGVMGYLIYADKFKPHSDQLVSKELISASTQWEYPAFSYQDGSWSTDNKNLQRIDYKGRVFWQIGDSPQKTVLIGDSNIEMYISRVNQLFIENPNQLKGTIFATLGECEPIAHNYTKVIKWCDGFAKDVYEFADKPDIDTVVIGAQWLEYYRIEPDNKDTIFSINEQELKKRIDITTQILQQHMAHLVSQNKKVYLLLNIPADPILDPKMLIKRSYTGEFGINNRAISKEYMQQKTALIHAGLKKAAAAAGANVIEPINIICDDTKCPSYRDGKIMYKDDTHFLSDYIRHDVRYLDDLVKKP